MEAIVTNLVERFEKGALTRRELIQGLTMLVAAGSGASAAAFQESAFKAAKIDHISIQVTNLPKSIKLFASLSIPKPSTPRSATPRRPCLYIQSSLAENRFWPR